MSKQGRSLPHTHTRYTGKKIYLTKNVEQKETKKYIEKKEPMIKLSIIYLFKLSQLSYFLACF